MAEVRLIDANALMKNIGKIPQLRGITYGRMKKAVEETPTIDAEPVRHGRWIKRKTHFAQGGVSAKCSACQKDVQYLGNPLNYCPNCGAKMDGGKEDEKAD